MAEIYVACCPVCEKQFKTRKALEKHFSTKHPGNDIPRRIEFSLANKKAPKVHPSLLKERDQYLEWLAEVVECINSAHNPNVPAKWCHFTFTNVRLDFFSHLLKRMGSATLNAVKECRHFKPPMWKEKALRMSFKTQDTGDVERALSEQSMVNLSLSKAFNGKTEIPSSALQLSGRAALEAAMKKKTAKKASLKSEIIIGEGQGRATRECELIWYPMFDTSTNGMLTVRIYVGKVHL